MRRRGDSSGVMPGEFEDAGDQQEQKEEAGQALAQHQGKMSAATRERKGTNGGAKRDGSEGKA